MKVPSAKRSRLISLFTLFILGVCAVTAAREWLRVEPMRTEPLSAAARRAQQPLGQQKIAPSITQAVNRWSGFIQTQFAGDEACKPCHVAEYEAHLRSGHSRTATAMARTDFAAQLLRLQEYHDSRRDQTFHFRLKDDQFWVSTNSQTTRLKKTGQGRGTDAGQSITPEPPTNVSVKVDWLLGSGTHAQTPIAIQADGSQGIELRWSAFKGHSDPKLTPDHEAFDQFQAGTAECFGRPMDAMDVRSCLGCHSTVVPPPPLPLTAVTTIANVGCERCHGPRKEHVLMAEKGMAEQSKPMINLHDAEAYMETCSACHRDERSVAVDATEAEKARFQPYGLKKSACYLAAPEQLTCSTCHDPHDTTSHDREQYIQQCNTCHQDADHTVCPKQPTGDCVECHMPLTEWTQGISFHDHWIRVVDDDSGATQTAPQTEVLP
ncbi:multiheme c-type cytochrome [Rhodopirellula halodulae]|uniref:multiheme c-type cytochrome n=1 Tax=Rhodopirellula halodulae TaxID=2894198 RepID=UPI001E31F7F7|nr:multiheme c-type cytochrome [Rhodopirellula sp. JC737]MCC9657420.1 heme-binding protein [Rhodopirellula sp. JC737]